MTEAVVTAIGKAVASLPDGVLDSLERLLAGDRGDAAVLAAAPTDASREHTRILLAARDAAHLDNSAIALAIATARERERAARTQRVSVVWTGPETFAVPVRRTDQALLQLIAMARERLIIVSFAVYKVPDVAAALIACAQRGCNVAVIVESEAESGGKVTFEMSKALGSEVAEHARLYTWPQRLRPDVGNGKSASLHAKCAVADRKRLLVSSANLTEYAFTKNMELGLLVEGGEVPARVQAHLEALIQRDILRPLVSAATG